MASNAKPTPAQIMRSMAKASSLPTGYTGEHEQKFDNERNRFKLRQIRDGVIRTVGQALSKESPKIREAGMLHALELVKPGGSLVVPPELANYSGVLEEIRSKVTDIIVFHGAPEGLLPVMGCRWYKTHVSVRHRDIYR